MGKSLLLIFLFILQVNSQSLNDSLVLYLPFTGSVTDISGNGYTVSNSGAALAPDRFGNGNSAYYFDGSDYMTIAGSQNLPNIDSTGYTVSLWVKPQTGQTVTWANIASFGRSGHGGYAFLCIEPWNGLFQESIYTNDVTNTISFDSDHTNLTAWSMLSFTYKDGIIKGYLNGVLIEEKESMEYTESGYDFIIGASASHSDNFIGWIDEVRIYNRALKDIEVAELSGLLGAVRATELDAYALTDFELGVLEPVKFSDYWAIWGGAGTGYTKTVENPLKAGANISNYCGAAITFPSTTSRASKTEYVLTTEDGLWHDHHHIMQWKLLFADSTILKLDNIVWDWMSLNQIHGGCQLYDGGECENGGSIAYGGGIFNDNVKAHNPDPSLYMFRYRAMPDSERVLYNLDIGKWMSFTYEIFWTHSNNGYWRVWKDGKLLGSADNVKTICDCCDENSNFLQMKTGLYNVWTDAVADSLPLYLDDLELYIDQGQGLNIKDICPDCDISGITSIKKPAAKQPGEYALQQNYPNPFNPSTMINYTLPAGRQELTMNSEISLKIYDILGREIKTLVNEQKPAGNYTVEWNGKNSAGQQVGSGIYFYQLKTGNGFLETKKMMLLR